MSLTLSRYFIPKVPSCYLKVFVREIKREGKRDREINRETENGYIIERDREIIKMEATREGREREGERETQKDKERKLTEGEGRERERERDKGNSHREKKRY
jgi:hypothetical protein